MHRFEPVLRVVLIVTWSIAVLSQVVLPLAGPEPIVLLVILCVLSAAAGVATAAVTYPGAWAILTSAGYRSLVGLWTTAIVSVVSGAIVATVGWLVTGSMDPWRIAGVVAGLTVAVHLAGLLAYWLVGEFFVAVVLVIRARIHHERAPFDRLATGTLLILVPAFLVTAVLSDPNIESVDGRGKLKGLELAATSLARTDGTPTEMTLLWIARFCLLGILACVIWILALRFKRRDHLPEAEHRAAP